MTITALLRLKPDPIPAVHAVPEYLADAGLRAVYEDTKAVLQVPWMGVVTMAFAHYPTFYATLWGGVREVAASAEFVDACRAVRASAEHGAAELRPRSLSEALHGIGYADGELEEIRRLIEVFSHGNMPYLLIATAARLLLEGHALSREQTATEAAERHGPSRPDRLTLMEPHHADAPTGALYDDIKATLGLPFVNTDYRALARWPSYFGRAWQDLRGRISDDAYVHAVDRVHAVAVNRALTVPNPGGLTPDRLREAAVRDRAPAEIEDVVRLFQWLLPGLTLNVAFFREQLLGAEETA